MGAMVVGTLGDVAGALSVPERFGPVLHTYMAKGSRPVVWSVVRRGAGLAVVAWELRPAGRRVWRVRLVDRGGRGLAAPLGLPWAGAKTKGGKADG